MKIVTRKRSGFLLLASAMLWSGCFLLSDFRNQDFVPAEGQKPVRLKVPKGWSKKELTTDSAGQRVLSFSYPYGPHLYITTDTGRAFYIDTLQHFPRPHLQGGIFYKGVMPGLLVWREVYSQGLRFGYRHVSLDEEARFDSSLNYLNKNR